MHYTLISGVRQEIVSAFCPVCCKRIFCKEKSSITAVEEWEAVVSLGEGCRGHTRQERDLFMDRLSMAVNTGLYE